MVKKPIIDQKKCIGCGACVSICKQVFELSENGKAQIKEDFSKEADCIEEAAQGCPVQAIKVEDKQDYTQH